MSPSLLKSLTGRRILITRPKGQEEGLCRLIEEAGGEPFKAPLIRIEPGSDPDAARALLHADPGWDWLIFVSSNAVRVALDALPWLGRLSGVTRIAAIGEATADALEKAGLQVDVVPYSGFNSEALLEDARLFEVAGKRVLILRGEGGREVLAEGLRARGAEVHYAELYQRVPVEFDEFLSVLERWPQGDFDAVVVTSGEALERLDELLSLGGASTFHKPPLVVPGERLSEKARSQGWSDILTADSASDESIARVLRQWAYASSQSPNPVESRPEPLVTQAPPATEEGMHPSIAAPVSLPEAGLVIPPLDVPAAELPESKREPEPQESAAEPAPIDLPAPVEAETPAAIEDLPLIPEEISTPMNADPVPESDQPVAEETPVVSEVSETPAASGKAGKKAQKAKEIPPKKGRSLAWVGYLMLIAVAALGVGGWFLLQELRSRQEGLGGQITDKTLQVREVSQQLTAVQTEIATLHAQLAAVQSQQATDDGKIERILGEQSEQQDLKMEAVKNDLMTSLQVIQRQLNKTRGDLLITDAEYLLSVANQKLALVGDVKSVLAAMEAADQRLRESGDPVVYKVRETLSGEMAALEKVVGLDVVGISADLMALEKKVASLPTILPHAGTLKQHESEKAREKEAPEAQKPENGDALDSALKGFKDLVTVRRTNRSVEAVLAPEEVEILKQLLLLKLETTRAALLRNDEPLYRDSLEFAETWVRQNFEPSAKETQEVLADLEHLKSHTLKVAFPDISRSLVMLQNIERLRLEAEDAMLHGKAPDKKAGAPMPSDVQPEAPLTPADARKAGAKDKKDKSKGAEPGAPGAASSPDKPQESVKPQAPVAEKALLAPIDPALAPEKPGAPVPAAPPVSAPAESPAAAAPAAPAPTPGPAPGPEMKAVPNEGERL